MRCLPPGELGKVAGPGRVPEVRTLRDKDHNDGDQGRRGSVDVEYLYVDGYCTCIAGDSRTCLGATFPATGSAREAQWTTG